LGPGRHHPRQGPHGRTPLGCQALVWVRSRTGHGPHVCPVPTPGRARIGGGAWEPRGSGAGRPGRLTVARHGVVIAPDGADGTRSEKKIRGRSAAGESAAKVSPPSV